MFTWQATSRPAEAAQEFRGYWDTLDQFVTEMEAGSLWGTREGSANARHREEAP
jgi:hypothetical protein